MELGQSGIPRRVAIWNTDQVILSKTPPVDSTKAILCIGDTSWDGITAGYFQSSSAGNYVAINAPSAFTGNLLSCTTSNSPGFGSVNRLTISASGVVSIPTITTSSAGATLRLGGNYNTNTLGSFFGSTSGTILSCNVTSAFAGNFLDFQTQSAVNTPNAATDSKFKIDSAGNVTSAGQINDATGVGSAARLYEYYFYS